MRLSRLRRWRPKKASLLAIVIALSILIIGSYILWSRQTWMQLTPRYTQWHQSIKSDIASAAALPASTAKEQDTAVTALKGVSTKIDNDRHAICSVHSLVQWQQNIITTFKNAHADCQKTVASTVDFQKQLATVIAYQADDRALAGILASVSQASQLAEGEWEAQMTVWGNATRDVEKMTVSDDFRPTQQAAIKHSTAIKTAWGEVIAAHQAKDKQKYLAAQGSLATALDALNEVSITSQQVVATLAGDLEKVSQSVFAN